MSKKGPISVLPTKHFFSNTFTKISSCPGFLWLDQLRCQLLPQCLMNIASKEEGKQGQSPPPASWGEQQGRGSLGLRESTINKLQWRSALGVLRSGPRGNILTPSVWQSETKDGAASCLGCNEWSGAVDSCMNQSSFLFFSFFGCVDRVSLPTAVVSRCHRDRVTTATPGHSKGRSSVADYTQEECTRGGGRCCSQ